MASQAADPIARERAVVGMCCPRITGRIWNRLDHVAGEGPTVFPGGALIDRELPRTLNPVATQTDALDRVGLLLVEGLHLAGELREEERIAPREAHR